jgi:PAS domain S-box-containing protein
MTYVQTVPLFASSPDSAASPSGSALRLLAAAAADLLAATDPNEMVRQVFQRASEYLGCDVFFNYMVRQDSSGRYLSLDVCAGLSAESEKAFKRLEFGQALCGATALLQKPQIVPFVQQSDNPQTAVVKTLGIRSYACQPLMVGGRVIGTLSFASRFKDEFSEKKLNFIEAVSYLIASAKERLRSEQETRQSEERFRLASEAVRGLLYDWNAITDTVWRSEKVQEITGYSIDEIEPSSHWWHRLMHPDDAAKVMAQLEEAQLSGQEFFHNEYRIRHKNGHDVWVWDRGRIVRDAAGQVVRVVGNTVDITEHMQAVEALKASELRFRAMIGASPFGIIHSDIDGGIHLANKAFLDMTGYGAEDIASGVLRWKDITPPEWLALDDKHVAEALEHGVCTPYEKEYIRKDGSRLPVLIGYAIFGDRKRDCVVFILDITEQKRIARALQESEALFKTMAEFIPQLAWIADAEGSIFWYNQHWYDYTGASPEEMMGLGWQKVHHTDELPRVMESWTACLQSGEPWEDVFPLRSHNGEYRWFLSRAQPIRDEEGRITRWFGTNTDVTEHRAAEAAVKEREEQLNLALEAGQLGFWDWNIVTGAVQFGGQWSHMLGYDMDEIEPHVRAWEKLIHPDEKDYVMQELTDHLEGRTPLYSCTHRLRHKNGSWRWILDRGRVVERDAQCHPLRAIGIHADVTEQRAAEESARKSESRLRQAQDAAGIGIHEYDVINDVVLWDTMVCDIWGIPHDMKVTYDVFKAGVHSEDWEKVDEAVAKALDPSGEGVYEAEYRVISQRDGTLRHVAATGQTTFEGNKAIRLIGTVMDVTAEREAEAALREAKEQAEAANVAKSEFLANMSHEIRTPMNAIVGLTNLLGNPRLKPEQQSHFIDTLKVSSQQLMELISDLLDLSKIESEQLRLESIPFNMKHLLDEVTKIQSIRAMEKGLSLTLDYQCHQEEVMGDPLRVKQVVMNLISNAVKFTEQGNVSLFVTGEPLPDGLTRYEIKVRDTGVGIREEQLRSIFAKFTQADSSITRKYGGTGLGLSIAKKLAEAMDGDITVESTYGQGSCFTVHVILQTHRTVSEQNAVAAPAADSASHHTCLLLVEDYPANVLVATSLLEDFGYAYEVASNGKEALQRLQNGTSYDLVLMDVQMPVMDGFEATRRLREWEKIEGRSPIPIIGMTAHALVGDREKCFEAGMDDYIPKPFQPDELQAKLKQFLSTVQKVS